jgi:hypothetical protein
MKTRTPLFILFIVVLFASTAYTVIQHPQEFLRRETWAIPVAIGVSMLITSVFDHLRQREASERHVKGVSQFLEMIKTTHAFSYRGIHQGNGDYQLEWNSKELNATVRLRIDGTSASCEFKNDDEKRRKFKGTPSQIAAYVQERITGVKPVWF